MRISVVPGHVNRLGWMLVQQRLQQLSNLYTPLATPENDDRFSRMVVDCPNAIRLLRLPGSWDHDLLTLGAQHRTQGGEPTEIELICVIKHLSLL